MKRRGAVGIVNLLDPQVLAFALLAKSLIERKPGP